jgi:hypothetical protein
MMSVSIGIFGEAGDGDSEGGGYEKGESAGEGNGESDGDGYGDEESVFIVLDMPV